MNPKVKGVIYILISAFFFALMAVFVKSLPEISLSQKMFFRNIIGLLVIGVSVFRNKVALIPKKPGLMFLRSLFGLLGVGFYYAAIERLPLANAVMINKLSPLFVVIFAAMFLHEKIDKKQKIALFIAFIGAIFVAQPTLDYSVIPSFLALFSAVFAAGAYTVIRKLSAYDRPKLIVFYFCLFSSLVMFPFMIFQGFVFPDFKQGLALLGIGVSALIAQMFMTHAYQYAEASEISVYNYSDTIFSILFGLLIWSEIPTVYTLLGGALIMAAGIMNYLRIKKVVPSK